MYGPVRRLQRVGDLAFNPVRLEVAALGELALNDLHGHLARDLARRADLPATAVFGSRETFGRSSGMPAIARVPFPTVPGPDASTARKTSFTPPKRTSGMPSRRRSCVTRDPPT